MLGLLPKLPKVGSTFESYVIEKELGRGGMGVVYLAHQPFLNTTFALKILFPEVVKEDQVLVKRFMREASLAAKIHHPNLIAVHNAGKSKSGLYYMVMDYVPGESLMTRMIVHGTVPVVGALSIIRQCADALKAAQHYHMVHRDIKPDNIMFDQKGVVRLADLGIAKATGDGEGQLTGENSIFGTPAYMSPEQAKSCMNVDTRADMYSLGVVLYEMLSGTRPFLGDNNVQILMKVLDKAPAPDVRTVAPDVPEPVALLIADLLQKDAARRISGPDELLQRIDGIQDAVRECEEKKRVAALNCGDETLRKTPDEHLPQSDIQGASAKPELPEDRKGRPAIAPILQKTDVHVAAENSHGMDDKEKTPSARIWYIIAVLVFLGILAGVFWGVSRMNRNGRGQEQPASADPVPGKPDPMVPVSPQTAIPGVVPVPMNPASGTDVQNAGSDVSALTVPTVPAMPAVPSASTVPAMPAVPTVPAVRATVASAIDYGEVTAGSIVVFGKDSEEIVGLVKALRASNPGKTVTLQVTGRAFQCREQLSAILDKKPGTVLLAVTSSYHDVSLANFEHLVGTLLDVLSAHQVEYAFLLEPIAGKSIRFRNTNETVHILCRRRGVSCLDWQNGGILDVAEVLDGAGK